MSGLKRGREQEVLQYYQYSADLGNVEAQTAVGHLLNQGAQGLEVDHKQVIGGGGGGGGSTVAAVRRMKWGFCWEDEGGVRRTREGGGEEAGRGRGRRGWKTDTKGRGRQGEKGGEEGMVMGKGRPEGEGGAGDIRAWWRGGEGEGVTMAITAAWDDDRDDDDGDDDGRGSMRRRARTEKDCIGRKGEFSTGGRSMWREEERKADRNMEGESSPPFLVSPHPLSGSLGSGGERSVSLMLPGQEADDMSPLPRPSLPLTLPSIYEGAQVLPTGSGAGRSQGHEPPWPHVWPTGRAWRAATRTALKWFNQVRGSSFLSSGHKVKRPPLWPQPV